MGRYFSAVIVHQETNYSELPKVIFLAFFIVSL
jgi:hypothetical protein